MGFRNSFLLFLIFFLSLSGSIFSQEGIVPVKIDGITISGINVDVYAGSSVGLKTDAIFNPFQPNGHNEFFESETMVSELTSVARAAYCDQQSFKILNVTEILLAEMPVELRLGFLADIVYQSLTYSQSMGLQTITIPVVGMDINRTMTEEDSAKAVLAALERFVNEVPKSETTLRDVQVTFSNNIAALTNGGTAEGLTEYAGPFCQTLREYDMAEALSTVSEGIGETLSEWKVAEIRFQLLLFIESFISERSGKIFNFVEEDISREERDSVNREIAKLLADKVMNEDMMPKNIIEEPTTEMSQSIKELHNRLVDIYGEKLVSGLRMPADSIDIGMREMWINLDFFTRSAFTHIVEASGIKDHPMMQSDLFLDLTRADGTGREVFVRLAEGKTLTRREYREFEGRDVGLTRRAADWKGKVLEIVGRAKP